MSRKVSLDLERSPVGMGIRKVGQWVSYSDFTDGASTSGTLALTKQIPAGSFVLGSKVTVREGFTGDTSCVMDIGDGSDADLFSCTTHDIYTAASNLMEGADNKISSPAGAYSGIVPISTATTITLTATSASDWGLVTAGKIYVEVFYLSTNAEVIDKVQTRYDF